jgi:hypothetical protein
VTPRFSKKQVLKCLLICAVSLLTLGGTSGCTVQKSTMQQLQGVWCRPSDTSANIVLSIGPDGNYMFVLQHSDLRFAGQLTVSQDAMRMVDYMCGTSMKGQYRFKLSGDRLFFSLLSDDHCDRNTLLPSDSWVRLKELTPRITELLGRAVGPVTVPSGS